jgi:CRISPR-associated protein Csh1
MINTYRLVGKIRMTCDKVSELTLAEQKKYLIRQFCADDSAFNYKDKHNDNQPKRGRIVLMKLDTITPGISFSAGVEIADGTCAEKLVLKNYAPADPNIYATHTGYKSIMAFTLLEYIQNNRDKINWSQPESVDTCLNYLQRIRNDFYVDDDFGLRPNFRLLPSDQQTGFPDPEINESLQNITMSSKLEKARKKAQKDYFEKELSAITGERPAYALSIDGKYLHELEEVSACYLDVLYYHIIDKQFAESKNSGFCHLCSAETSLAKDVYLKQKFYGVKNPYFFDGVSASMSKTAFSMCKDCYNEVTVGTQYAAKKFKSYVLGLNCLVLPELDLIQESNELLIDPHSMKAITALLRHHNKSVYKDSLDIVKRLQNRLRDFSLFFYFKPSPTSQEFIINRLIKGISLSSLIEKGEDLTRLSLDNCLTEIFNENYSLSFEGLRFLLLPSMDSHPNLKPTDYQRINRDILSLLSVYLYSQQMDLSFIIKRFVDIYSRKHNNLGDRSTYALDLSPYVINLYITHLQHFNQLKSQKTMEVKPMTTTLEHDKLLEYFNNHPSIYANNHAAQGLFILGWYLSDLEYEQRKKGTHRTAIHKLNLRGIPLQKVKSVMATIDDLRQVWKVYQDSTLDAYYRECLSEIEQSTMSPEDVVFHILCGRAYKTYIGLKTYKEKQANNTNQEAQND